MIASSFAWKYLRTQCKIEREILKKCDAGLKIIKILEYSSINTTNATNVFAMIEMNNFYLL